MTFFDELKCSFVDVSVSADNEICTAEFLEASDGLRDMFNLFNSSAFSPVQSDMTGNITKIWARSAEIGDLGKTLQGVVLSEAAQKKKDATQGLLWLTRGLRFTLTAMERSLANPNEELTISFSDAYSATLSKYHSMLVRPVFKLAMKACPYRKDLYEKLGSPLDKVVAQMSEWLKALNKIVTIIEEYLMSGTFTKGQGSGGMCRFMIYKGQQAIRLEHLLTRPAHSIINQSFDSRLRIDMRRPMNGDGFGVGYYPDDNVIDETETDEEKGPCVYCATTPAWNNLNLERIASKTHSRMVFAHVRASTAGVLSETNCHPFMYHTLMFMHNGGVSYFADIKRKMMTHIAERYFLFIQGGTDSEACFALFLDFLEKEGVDPASKVGQFPHELMERAILNTIELIVKWSLEAAARLGVTDPEPSLLNFAVTDGESVIVTRYISSKNEEAASLYYSTGTRFFEYAPGQYKMERCHRLNSIVMVASEPLTFERPDWIAIPTNTLLVIRKNPSVLIKPIRDEFYVSDPTKMRSSELMEKKGFASPLVEPSPKRQLGSQRGVPPLGREGRKLGVSTV